MREIKFRVWDTKDKVMYFPSEIQFGKHGTYVPRHDIDWKYDHSDAGCVGKRYALMQFTGLKDKNGKEVYEDDLLKDFCGKIWKMEVGVGCCDSIFGYLDSSTDEVIGNIHENPDLLKT